MPFVQKVVTDETVLCVYIRLLNVRFSMFTTKNLFYLLLVDLANIWNEHWQDEAQQHRSSRPRRKRTLTELVQRQVVKH